VWLLGVGLAALACLLVLLLPIDTPAWVGVTRGASIVAVGVFLWAVVRMPPAVRGVWWGLWLFQALTVAGDVVYDVIAYHFGEEPFPSIADAFYLASYAAVITALAMLVHRRHQGRDRETWIDTAIMTVPAASWVATIIMVPVLTRSTVPDAVMSLAYPFLDVIVCRCSSGC
jgi:hypothetical protein